MIQTIERRRLRHVLLDPAGNVLQEWNGYLRAEEVGQVLEAALARQPALG